MKRFWLKSDPIVWKVGPKKYISVKYIVNIILFLAKIRLTNKRFMDVIIGIMTWLNYWPKLQGEGVGMGF